MMNRKELKQYIQNTFNVNPDYPWVKQPDNEVFRHNSNKKWFALIMNVEKSKLGLLEEGMLEVVNLKCDATLSGSLHNKNGIFPGYHMNKSSWITVALDGSVDDETIKMLVDLSYEATLKNEKKNYLKIVEA